MRLSFIFSFALVFLALPTLSADPVNPNQAEIDRLRRLDDQRFQLEQARELDRIDAERTAFVLATIQNLPKEINETLIARGDPARTPVVRAEAMSALGVKKLGDNPMDSPFQVAKINELEAYLGLAINASERAQMIAQKLSEVEDTSNLNPPTEISFPAVTTGEVEAAKGKKNRTIPILPGAENESTMKTNVSKEIQSLLQIGSSNDLAELMFRKPAPPPPPQPLDSQVGRGHEDVN